ncbi:TIGR02285 family protein [Idiomarina sp. HP20-50]|uniref:TIGR02285 family protein n=1 Tax=Idiomarina sp. HP20-50 TaxID=3070813 RepID=UPI00294B0E7B|nr:TIGR02285 family protein [Idiomarina sp. HP20-50]MDV6315218.1 TIGR02285 family protein [Idiomarina sp. HP20-50]
MMFKKQLALLSLALVFCQSSIASEEDIIWGTSSSPPFHVFSGVYEGQGFCDALVTGFQRQLPELSHRVRKLPSRRITMIMKKNKNLCFPCLIKRTSYNSEFNYTDTTHLYPPHGIITTADNAKKIIQKYGHPVRFSELVKDADLRFAQPTERRYGRLQPLLEEHLIDSENFSFISGQNAHVNLLTMLVNDRIDYTVDYKMVMVYYNETKDKNSGLVFLPIKEYDGVVIEGAVGCTDNEWGRNAVDQLNKVIQQLQADPDFQRSLDKWLGNDRPK